MPRCAIEGSHAPVCHCCVLCALYPPGTPLPYGPGLRVPRVPHQAGTAYPGWLERGCSHSPARTPPADCRSPACMRPSPERSPQSHQASSGRPGTGRCAQKLTWGTQPQSTAGIHDPQNTGNLVPQAGHCRPHTME